MDSLKFKQALLEDIIPFWEEHSPDQEHGGFFSCLDRRGEVYDTDKFIWQQGRQSWMFSFMYNNVEKKATWLRLAKSGVDFLKDYAMDNDGNFYFSTTREGKPLIQPYNIFSDCFAAMAFGQYAKASGDEEIRTLGKKVYFNILRRKENPKGKYEKSTGERPLKSLALPMILSNLVLELEDVLSTEEIEKTLDRSVHEVMNIFLRKEEGLIFENLNPDGSFNNSFEGRLINPGHGIEAMWFMMDIGARKNDKKLIEEATQVVLNILEFSWDRTYGGIFYFLDVKDYPLQQLEWDQKLWWVHLEALIALSKAYQHTGNREVWKWWKKVSDYTWKNFPDPEYGEWFGYLNRQGAPHLYLKGAKFKGCFHLPRAMFQCWKSVESIEIGAPKKID